MHDFPGRYGSWALICGASVGLGAAFAASAASRGFDVVLVARRAGALEVTARALRHTYGVQTRCVVADLADPGAADAIVGAITDLDLGLVVYNAAAEPAGRFLDVPLVEHAENLAVNCWTPTVLAHQLGGAMTHRGRGAFVIVSSMAALQGIKMFVSYGAAKAYELILAEGLWDEFREHGVDVLGYVVGATASANYQGLAADAQHAAADSDGATTMGRLHAPATVESVAERLFDLLGDGPRQYSHVSDEASAAAAATRPRSEVVAAMGSVTPHLARFAPGGSHARP